MHRRVHGLFLIIVPLLVIGAVSARRRSSSPRVYRNLYGDQDFRNHEMDNILASGLGIVEFARQSYLWHANATMDVTPQDDSSYDFIVVGAGTSGAALAARLAEIPNFKVLLIEAGPDETMKMGIPLLVGGLQADAEINWKYTTEPSNKYCVGMEEHKCKWPRGKVMGGSSVLNYMIATRGSPEDYDRWARMGNKGWAYKDVLKYFKKLENIRIPEYRNDTTYRGTEGPVSISQPSFHTPVAEAFVEAGRELGYPVIDYNGKNNIGFSYLQTTTYQGYRVSSNKAYLHGKHMPNLDVTKKTMVHRILFDKTNKRAIGVLFKKNGRFTKVYAKKEVVICAGAVGSPQLLMLSGIGPAEHLRDMGIRVVKDSAVGDNVMDHIAFAGLSFAVNQPVTIRQLDITDLGKPYIKDFFLRHTGPITIPGGCESIAFLDVDNPKKRRGLPSVELLQLGGTIYESKTFTEGLGLNRHIQNMFSELRTKYAYGILPMLLKPRSRGWVRLKSKDINVKPKIVPNYLDHPEDIRLMIAGIRVSIELSQTKAFKRFGAKVYNKTVPGCEGHRYDSDDYWLCHIRMETMNIYHYSGTCKMGARSDKTAVVDPRLKVIGVKGLRVIDSSIMPEIISAHTNIPSFMIAEKGADMIKQDWGYPIV